MTPEERNLITGLFDRLKTADSSSQNKDAEADQLIRQSTAAQPSAPYLLVQTLLVQEHALSNALARIKGLEQDLAQAKSAQSQSQGSGGGGGGGFLSGLFGHHANPSPTPAQGNANIPPQHLPQAGQPQGYAQQTTPPPFPTTTGMAPGAGGGFLRSALTTAAGVAGGALLFQGIEGLLGHNAGPFGPALGNGGFFGGGGGSGFLNTGGRPEIIENNEVINNYYDSGGNREEPRHISNDANSRADDDIYQAALTDDSNSSGNASQEDTDIYNAALADNSSDAVDNTYDSGNPDAGGGGGGDYFAGDSGSDLGGDNSGGGGNDDSSYV